jgi:energy-coupling factor transporter ATP-binding protein EcfA2
VPTGARFPQTLLEQSARERRAYFRDYTLAHPHLVEVYQQLRVELTLAEAGSLIFVCGPSGIGKTTLLKRLEQKVLEELKPELEQAPGRFPLVMCEALSPETGNFNWKDFYRRLLLQLAEPCIEKKIIPGQQHRGQPNENHLTVLGRAGVTELRHAVEQALRARRPLAVCIDEAQHLAKMASGRKLQDQLDCLKSLANQTEVPLVLSGHYELLAFRNLSAQLSRRSRDLHFRRYDAEVAAELETFKNILWSFGRHLPLPTEPLLVEHWDYLYERSLGCVGILKPWLLKAYALALQEGGQRLTLPQLEQTAPPVARCRKMLADLQEGENRLQETPEARQQLRQQLGLAVSTKRAAAPASAAATAPSPKRPGQRAPTRDPVGKGA